MIDASTTLPSPAASPPHSGEPIRALVVFGNIPLLGHERGNMQVFNALKTRGVDALFVTNKAYGHEVIQPELDLLGHRWDVATYPRLFSRGMDLKTWGQRLRSLMKGAAEFWRIGRAYEPTHVHVGHMMHFLMMLPAILLLGVPVVYRVGDAPSQHRPIFRFLWRHVVIPQVDHFVCVSEYIRDLIFQAGAPSEKVSVIYSFPSERSADLTATPVPVDPYDGVTVLYMGQLSQQKGVDLFVESAISLCRGRDDVRFLIAGDYSWQNPFANKLIQQVKDLGLEDRILFLGYVANVPALLELADLHVCPSVCQEALSNTVLEAKRAGVASVVFPSGGLPELIQHGADGYVCLTKSSASLREGIESMIGADRAALDQAGRRARASLERLGITIESFTDAWLDIYRSVDERTYRRTHS